MTEINFNENLAAEIAELEKLITEKRNLIEQKSGLVSEGTDRELVREVLADKIYGTPAPAVGPAMPVKTLAAGSGSYLDYLDKENAAKVSQLLTLISQEGLAKAIAEARRASQNEPFLLDAFHDAAADYLGNHLRAKAIN